MRHRNSGPPEPKPRSRRRQGHRQRLRHRQWRWPWLSTLAGLVILAGVTVFLYPQAAAWFSQKEQSRVTELAQATLAKPPHSDEEVRAERLARAHAYNEALASGAMFHANDTIATGAGTTLDYAEILDVTGNGFMGRLRYDALQIDLPIYHGTSDETLERGVGHLEGTSLPVGGEGTRSVLTAHRGLPSATLFTNLDRAATGDTFSVSVLDEVYTYRVVEIAVIEPEETTEILPVPGRDLVTLVTCTPLGINSHRILVTAERVTPTPAEDIEKALAAPDLPGFPWWAVVLSATVLGVTVYVWRSGYGPERTRAQQAA